MGEGIPELKESDITNFIRLISWASRSYSAKLVRREFDYQYFYSEGLKLLDKCMRFFYKKAKENPECLYSYRKAKKPDMRVAKNSETIMKLDNRLGKNGHPVLSSLAFSKYFRTALFRRFDNIRRMTFAAKRQGLEIPLEEWSGILSKNMRGDLDALEYSELVEDIATKIDNGLERQVFLLHANPPEKLCELALFDNRRRLKIGAIRRLNTGKKNNWGGKNVVISDKNVRDFLVTLGYKLSPPEYEQVLGDMRKKVSEIIRK